MKIYTKTGDKGTTSTYSGERVQKDDERIILTGLIDNVLAGVDLALIHLNRLQTFEGNLVIQLQDIQKKLWQTAGEVSLSGIDKNVKEPIKQDDVVQLEKFIDQLGKGPTSFVRFSKPAAVYLNEARVRCRTLEIALTKLYREDKVRKEIYAYINRLSDCLYMMAYSLEN